MIAFGLCALLTLQAAGAPPAVSPQLVAAAEKGDADAQFKLGRAYAEGVGVPADPYQAVDQYRRAAEQGHALAQTQLGRSYLRGEGVVASDVEGLRWMRKAADQGSGEALFALADFYAHGARGLDEDQRLAFRLSHQAASQGYMMGALHIALLYEFGDVVPKDYVLAYAWESLAGTLATRAGGEPNDAALRNLAQKMTKPQRAAAEKLVREWGGKVPPLATISSQPASTAPKADAATIALAGTLSTELQEKRYFTEATLERPEGLAALAHLALTSKEAPLVQAAYEAMERQLSSMVSKEEDPRSAHPLVNAAIMAGLRRNERPILDKALRASSALNLGQGHSASLQAMVDLALKHPEPDIRYAALNALYQVGIVVSTRSELVPEVMALAMEDSNEAIVVTNLQMFGTMGRASAAYTAQLGKITRSLERLRREGSPALRASAIGATAKMYYSGSPELSGPRSAPSADAEAFGFELLRALDDPSPIVRGQAASAVAVLPYVDGAIPKLVAMLDDTASVSGAAVSGLRSLGSGDPIELPVRVVELGEPETVAMTALRALMVRSLYQDAKQASKLKCDDPARTFKECAARARAWGRRR